MSEPPVVVPGYGPEAGPTVYPTHEWAPGVEVVQSGPAVEGAPVRGVSVVHEMGPGVRPVYFVNGLPEDSIAQTQQRMLQAHLAASVPQSQVGQEDAPESLLTIL